MTLPVVNPPSNYQEPDDLIARIVEAVLCFVRNLTEQYAGELSDEVYRNRSRVLPDLRTKQRGLKKTIVTEIGVLELPKDLYVDRESRKSVTRSGGAWDQAVPESDGWCEDSVR